MAYVMQFPFNFLEYCYNFALIFWFLDGSSENLFYSSFSFQLVTKSLPILESLPLCPLPWELINLFWLVNPFPLLNTMSPFLIPVLLTKIRKISSFLVPMLPLEKPAELVSQIFSSHFYRQMVTTKKVSWFCGNYRPVFLNFGTKFTLKLAWKIILNSSKISIETQWVKDFLAQNTYQLWII